MADRLLTLLKKVVFRAAFGIYIVFQVVALALLLAAISHFVPDDNFVVGAILTAAFFIGQFVIGTASLLVFQRMTRIQYVVAESERWLAERRHPNPSLLKRRKTIKRWAGWIPTAIVVLTWIFLDEAWSFASHVLHPQSGKLIGYQVSIPLTWTIRSNTYVDQDNGNSIVAAERYRGLPLAWSSLSMGGRPSFSTSTMNFRSIPAGDPLASKPSIGIISTRTVPFGKGTITCWEEFPPHWMIASRYIACSTPKGDFSAGFSGNEEDASQFYRTLKAIKPTN